MTVRPGVEARDAGAAAGQGADERLVMLEHGPDGAPVLFRAPREVIVACHADKVAGALARAEALRAEGAWIAGVISYEAGLALEPKLALLMPASRPGPLLALGVFEAPEEAGPWLAARSKGAARISRPRPVISQHDHARAIQAVLDHVAAGDCYQVNLTFPLTAELIEGDAFSLYMTLRNAGAAGHGAVVALGAGPEIVSLSPELFFSLGAEDEDGAVIETRPMKGTRPRDADPVRDAELARDLASSEKDRAENLMIVDLLRNDISRLARAGSVEVPKLFEIETWPSVHQMTSTVRARLQGPARLDQLMGALFPCGSVTGAPKIAAMQIIRALEVAPRGAYCGAIGWMAPDGRADFSVAIRTLSLQGDRITLNVGGGVVHDSTARGEWEEALWKTRFVNPALSPASS